MYPVFTSSAIAAAVFILLYVLWCGMELVLGHSRRPGSEALVQDRRSGLAVLGAIWLTESVGWAAAFGAPAFAIAGLRPVLFALGIVLAAAGILLRWYAVRLLGRYFTVVLATQPGQAVVEKGPYRLIRHPAYAGGLLTIIGFGMAFTNWISLAAALVLPAVAYAYRIAVEENALQAALGEDYRQYMKRTKRIIPFVI